MYRGPWREGRLWAGLGRRGPGLPRWAGSSSERVKEPRAGTGEAGSSATCSLSGSANSSVLGQDLCPQVPKSPGSRSRASEQQGPAPPSGGAWPARVRDLLGQSRAQGASFPSWDTTLPGPLSLPGLPGPRPWPVRLGRRSAPHTWQLPERFQGGGLKDETL